MGLRPEAAVRVGGWVGGSRERRGRRPREDLHRRFTLRVRREPLPSLANLLARPSACRWSPLSLAMMPHKFDSLALPSTVVVPEGALDKASRGGRRERRALLMRAVCETSLADQHATIKKEADIYKAELLQLQKEDGEFPVITSCLISGLFSEYNYTRRPDEQPANKIALAAAAELLLTRRGAKMDEVATTFLASKQRALHALRARFGEAIYVPSYLTRAVIFDDAAAVTLLKEESSWWEAYGFICNRLNVIRLPVKSEGGHWALALVPNVVGASNADVIDQVASFYELFAARARLGAALTADDVRNLKVILPAGSGARTLVDFLVVKFADRATRDALGYTPGRAKSLVRRYDAFAQQLRTERTKAELKVAGKVIKTTGKGVKGSRRQGSTATSASRAAGWWRGDGARGRLSALPSWLVGSGRDDMGGMFRPKGTVLGNL